jgi:hypothetical protein
LMDIIIVIIVSSFVEQHTCQKKETRVFYFISELNYVYVLNRQVLDIGGGPYHDKAGCMLCCFPALGSWIGQNE